MGLENENTLDAGGVEKDTGFVALTIMDSWDWSDEKTHLHALQAKFNRYIALVESREIVEIYPEAAYKTILIRLVSRVPLPPIGEEFLKYAADVCRKIGIRVDHVFFPGSDESANQLGRSA